MKSEGSVDAGPPLCSRRALRAGAMFGLEPGRGERMHQDRLRAARRCARAIDSMLLAGEVALITGPSGSGKSTILRALRARLRAEGGPIVVAGPRLLERALGRARRRLSGKEPAVVDLLRSRLPGALRVLARAGLAEAAIFVAPAGAVSEGQRARLVLALGMEAARATSGDAGGAGVTLVVDELASTLDRVTGAGVAGMLGNWVRGTAAAGVRLVAATAHDDLAAALGADVLVHQPLIGEATIRRADR